MFVANLDKKCELAISRIKKVYFSLAKNSIIGFFKKTIA